ncbi:MAG: hypothetical protein NDI69_10440 [Bacteriovoracaceae bacterium]|nr:hypothetical protein [Bacteriovoracaceae bacterium]
MVIKFLLLTLLVTGCGREVKLSNSKLEKFSSITEADVSKIYKSGTLIRAAKNGDSDYIKINSSTYKVSPYSSFDVLKFISNTPVGAEVSVKFSGTIKKTDIVLETITAN